MPTRSEASSKRLLAAYGVPVVEERLVDAPDDAAVAAEELGYPVVLKLCGAGIAHKTERGLVKLGIADATSARRAAEELLKSASPDDGPVEILVARMVRGARELIAGMHRDEHYGPTVMVGMGGILAEAVGDVAFRLAPIERVDALEMIDDLRTSALLGPFRGEPEVDRDALAEVLTGLSRVAGSEPGVVSVDINPLIVVEGRAIAVDALVEDRPAQR